MPDGKSKPPGLRKLEQLDANTHKKLVASIADGHPAAIRDIKNLALILLYCLKTKQNIVLYTADADPATLFLRWLEAMSMRSTLTLRALEALGDEGRTKVSSGRAVKVELKANDFIRDRQSWFIGMLMDHHKTSACRFTIKRWDQTARRFDESIFVWFERKVADVLSDSHGNFWCPFAMNAELGNWLNLLYRWPPRDPTSDKLELPVRRKPIFRTSVVVTPEEHSRECKYRIDDESEQLYGWSQFSWDPRDGEW